MKQLLPILNEIALYSTEKLPFDFLKKRVKAEIKNKYPNDMNFMSDIDSTNDIFGIVNILREYGYKEHEAFYFCLSSIIDG